MTFFPARDLINDSSVVRRLVGKMSLCSRERAAVRQCGENAEVIRGIAIGANCCVLIWNKNPPGADSRVKNNIIVERGQ